MIWWNKQGKRMADLSHDEAVAASDALRREAKRLDTAVKDYNAVKNNTRNAAVKAMADEGAASAQERATKLLELANKIDPRPVQGAKDKGHSGGGSGFPRP